MLESYADWVGPQPHFWFAVQEKKTEGAAMHHTKEGKTPAGMNQETRQSAKTKAESSSGRQHRTQRPI